MSDFWKAGIKLRFNASEHEENINFEQVLDPKGYDQGNLSFTKKIVPNEIMRVQILKSYIGTEFLLSL